MHYSRYLLIVIFPMLVKSRLDVHMAWHLRLSFQIQVEISHSSLQPIPAEPLML